MFAIDYLGGTGVRANSTWTASAGAIFDQATVGVGDCLRRDRRRGRTGNHRLWCRADLPDGQSATGRQRRQRHRDMGSGGDPQRAGPLPVGERRRGLRQRRAVRAHLRGGQQQPDHDLQAHQGHRRAGRSGHRHPERYAHRRAAPGDPCRDPGQLGDLPSSTTVSATSTPASASESASPTSGVVSDPALGESAITAELTDTGKTVAAGLTTTLTFSFQKQENGQWVDAGTIDVQTPVDGTPLVERRDVTRGGDPESEGGHH